MQSDLDEGGGRVGRGGPTCTAGRTYLQSGAGRRRCGPGALGAVGPVDFFIKDVLWNSSYVFVPEHTWQESKYISAFHDEPRGVHAVLFLASSDSFRRECPCRYCH